MSDLVPQQRRALSNFPKLLTPKEVAALLGVSEGTLAQWRFHRQRDIRRVPQLRYIKVGGAVRYPEADLLAFLHERTVAR
jgi:predicted DNA-binding transcriptional regulator AlpA